MKSEHSLYIPEIIPAIKKPATEEMRSPYWKLPKNWKEMMESVAWAAGTRLTLETNAPETVAIEVTEKEDRSGIIVHLLNYNNERDSVLKNIRVSLEIPDKQDVDNLEVFSPDNNKTVNIDFHIENNRLIFVIPELKTYDLAVISLRCIKE